MQLNITGFSESELLSLILMGLTAQKARLEETIAVILVQLDGPPSIAPKGRPAAAPVKLKATRGPMSEEAKAKIVAAQKKRWAKYHKEQKAAAKAANGAPVAKRTRKAAPPPAEVATAEAVQ